MATNIYLKKPQTRAFSKPLFANKNSCQSLAELLNLEQAANHKILYIISFSAALAKQ